MTLEVRSRNHTADNYTKVAFEQIASRPNYYITLSLDDAIIYQRNLVDKIWKTNWKEPFCYGNNTSNRIFLW